MSDSDDLRAKYHRVQVEVITVDTPSVIEGVPPSGWGEHAGMAVVEGKAVEILVRREKEAVFGIRILDDGSFILTGYGANLKPAIIERNFRFPNARPWGKPKNTRRKKA